MSVPSRVVHVVSSVPRSFTLPTSPVHEGHTAFTLVPCLVAFRFACTGEHAFPIAICVPITTGSIEPVESPVTSSLPATMYRPPGQGVGFDLAERTVPVQARKISTDRETLAAARHTRKS
jgi:hypothetical protein